MKQQAGLPRRSQAEEGMTLIELMVAIGISAMVLTAVVFFGLDLSDFGLLYTESLQVQQELQLTLRAVSEETRSAGSADNGAYAISAASSSSFTFYSDLDGDNKFEQIRYFVDGAVLKRGVTNSTGIPPAYPPADEKIRDVVHNLTNVNIFKFYDDAFTGSQAPLAVPVDVSRIRLLKITLAADQNPARPPAPVTMFLFSNIRNMRTNLQ